MAKYTTYASHKATNITGLENIPEHWELKQVRYLLLDGQDGIKIGPFGSALKLEDMVEVGYKVYGQENVIKKDFSLGKRWISENKFKAMQVYRVHSGDILITMMGTSGKCEIVPDDHQTGIIDSHLIRLGLQKDKMLPKFFKVLIDGTLEIEYQVKIQGKGSIMHGLNSSIIKSLELPIPPLSEQKDILNFLDHETAQIDTLIEKQQTLIQLLKEKRQAVISHAVTKGLNPDAPMKDSGVEWLGEVPEHWEVGRLKNVLRIRNGRDYKAVEVENGGYPVYGSGGIFKRSSDYLFDGESVLFGRKGTIDKPLLVSGKFWTVDTMFYSEVFNNAKPDYIYHQALLFPFDKLSTNTALPSMTQEDLLELGFAIPPINEQQEICQHLNNKLAMFSNLVDKAEQAIQFMQERRTALISAAVTGKIDVRGWEVRHKK